MEFLFVYNYLWPYIFHIKQSILGRKPQLLFQVRDKSNMDLFTLICVSFQLKLLTLKILSFLLFLFAIQFHGLGQAFSSYLTNLMQMEALWQDSFFQINALYLRQSVWTMYNWIESCLILMLVCSGTVKMILSFASPIQMFPKVSKRVLLCHTTWVSLKKPFQLEQSTMKWLV